MGPGLRRDDETGGLNKRIAQFQGMPG